MAAVLNVDIDGLGRVEQYEDDSLEAWFTDGTRVSLTACGSVFTRQGKANSGQRTPQTVNHQFTAYAGREWRDRVRRLLAFRNHFAERPFLPPSLLRQDTEVLDHLIEYVAWPSTLEQATRDNRFRTDSAGNVQLFSGDGCACVELACHGQTLTSAYLARVAGEETEHHVAVEGSEAAETSVVNLEEEKVSYHYVWRKTVHSVTRPPEVWKHPLSLLQQYQAHDSHVTSPTHEKENVMVDAVVSTLLPRTLPLTCPNAHLHHQTQACQRIKVLLTEGIIYHIFLDHSQPFVEILPNQSTVLRSHDSQGRFFQCWSVPDRRGCVQRSMFCVDHAPSSSGLSFSMARVMGQASRLLNQVLKLTRPQNQICWKIPSPLPSPPSCPRYYTVPGLGRFTLRANGHIRCVFVDRTIVDFYLPPSQPSTTPRLITGSEHSSSNCGGSSANSPCPPGMSVAGGARGVEVARGVWIGGNLCRVMQPNGRYKMVSTQHPSSHHRYIEVVKEWCDWVSLPENERGQFRQRTIYDQSMQREVLAELSKIDRFNTIFTSHQHPPSLAGSCIDGRGQLVDGCGLLDEGCGHPAMSSFVRDALKRTEGVVQDIDRMLAS